MIWFICIGIYLAVLFFAWCLCRAASNADAADEQAFQQMAQLHQKPRDGE